MAVTEKSCENFNCNYELIYYKDFVSCNEKDFSTARVPGLPDLSVQLVHEWVIETNELFVLKFVMLTNSW